MAASELYQHHLKAFQSVPLPESYWPRCFSWYLLDTLKRSTSCIFLDQFRQTQLYNLCSQPQSPCTRPSSFEIRLIGFAFTRALGYTHFPTFLVWSVFKVDSLPRVPTYPMVLACESDARQLGWSWSRMCMMAVVVMQYCLRLQSRTLSTGAFHLLPVLYSVILPIILDYTFQPP